MSAPINPPIVRFDLREARLSLSLLLYYCFFKWVIFKPACSLNYDSALPLFNTGLKVLQLMFCSSGNSHHGGTLALMQCFVLFILCFVLTTLTVTLAYPEVQLFIVHLSSQDLARTELWEAASSRAPHCPGIPGQAISDGGLQVWPAHLHPCHFLWPASHFSIQRRPCAHGHREIPCTHWGQPGESLGLTVRVNCDKPFIRQRSFTALYLTVYVTVGGWLND